MTNDLVQIAAVVLLVTALAFPRRVLRGRSAWRELALAVLVGTGIGLDHGPGIGLVVFGAVLLGASEGHR